MRLIDADALKELFDERLDGAHIQVAIRRTGKTLWSGIHAGVNWSRNMIIEAPTIDPESLRPKGRWEEYCNFWRKCSICGCTWHEQWVMSKQLNYCPNCGAKMEG